MRELGEPELTWRRLRVLLNGMPDSSNTRAAISGLSEADQMWTLDRHLLAALVDRIGVSNYLMGESMKAQGMFGKNGKNPINDPEPIERPGIKRVETPGKRKGVGMKSLVRALGAPV